MEDRNLDFTLLTRTVGNIPVISLVYSWIVDIMGMIMSFIFEITSSFGIFNIGVCIIIFTIVTRIIMFPLSYKQAKSQKMMSVVQPEIAAIQKKYQGKESDQKSAMMMQAEIKSVYEKYGVSMTGGCIQLIIQMPILFALYKVILNIPAYVGSVKIYFQNIVDAIGGASAIEAVNTFAHSSEALTNVITQSRIKDGIIATTDNIIDFLYHLNPAQWTDFTNNFSQFADAINNNYQYIEQMNNFLGINLATSPGAYGMLSIKAWIIPVLAGLSQYISTKIISSASGSAMMNDENNPTASTMKSMNIMMPIISVFFCFSFASGIGIYWIASSVIMGLQQYLLNKHFNKMNVDDLVKENLDKVNAKRAKKGLPPINEKSSQDNLKRLQERNERVQAALEAKQAASKKRVSENDSYYVTNSIADRANMVQQYEERKSKKK
jgi:YidC/Oxa1 family membrane protein insertase